MIPSADTSHVIKILYVNTPVKIQATEFLSRVHLPVTNFLPGLQNLGSPFCGHHQRRAKSIGFFPMQQKCSVRFSASVTDTRAVHLQKDCPIPLQPLAVF